MNNHSKLIQSAFLNFFPWFCPRFCFLTWTGSVLHCGSITMRYLNFLKQKRVDIIDIVSESYHCNPKNINCCNNKENKEYSLVAITFYLCYWKNKREISHHNQGFTIFYLSDDCSDCESALTVSVTQTYIIHVTNLNCFALSGLVTCNICTVCHYYYIRPTIVTIRIRPV